MIKIIEKLKLVFRWLCCYENKSIVRYQDYLDTHYKYYNSDCELKEESSDTDDNTCYL